MSPYIIVLFFLCATNVIADDIFTEWMIDMLYYVEYHVYSRDNPSTPNILKHGDEDALYRFKYKRRNGTIFYIHGWSDSISDVHAQQILSAYLQSTDYNIILTDWSSIASSYYFVSAPSATIVGQQIAKMMKWMERHNRLNISDIHIVGKSLGAQVAGFVGKALKPKQVRRITGLDAAGPYFDGISSWHRLDKSDAKFVDLIHTSLLGVALPYGHADFYANYGVTHPGCFLLNLACNHGRAVDYFIESITNPNKYPTCKCQYDNKESQLKNCQANSAYMGHFADPNNHGIFRALIT